MRLFGGSDNVGIAEVCFNGLWADICDDVDQATIAKTFCKQLKGEDFCKCTLAKVCPH